VWPFVSPPHTRLEKVERTSIFKYGYLHFNKQGGTKSSHIPLAHMNGPLRFIRNLVIGPSPYKFQHLLRALAATRPSAGRAHLHRERVDGGRERVEGESAWMEGATEGDESCRRCLLRGKRESGWVMIDF
jgi:hypothetical protein